MDFSQPRQRPHGDELVYTSLQNGYKFALSNELRSDFADEETLAGQDTFP